MQKYEGDNYTIYQDDMLNLDSLIPENSIDSIITDPPYELNFMNKGWDNSGIAFQKETWEKCYKVLKPGGYLLAFGGSRTFHRIAVAIEDAGFEIRDVIMWLYGSGFPKSMNIGLAIDKKNGVDNRTGKINKGVATNNTLSMKNGLGKSQEFASTYVERIATNKYKGWGTALKPSYEPIIVARKRFKGSCVDNVLEYGTGGINIDECRVETNDIWNRKEADTNAMEGYNGMSKHKTAAKMNTNGRFPANTILTYDNTDYEEVCGGFPLEKSGSASRYFYCAKASKRDRDEGLKDFREQLYAQSGGSQSAIAKGEEYHKDGIGLNQTKLRKNIHPTVKPTSLMQYLVRLVTAKGGTVLDCFNGSGSTGKAVMYENKDREANYKYIGIEREKEYIDISIARIEYAIKNQEEDNEEMKNQMSIFDYEDE